MRETPDLGIGLAVLAGISSAVKGKKSYRVGQPARRGLRPVVKARVARDAEGKPYLESRTGRRHAIVRDDGRVELARKTTKQERKAMRRTRRTAKKAKT